MIVMMLMFVITLTVMMMVSDNYDAADVHGYDAADGDMMVSDDHDDADYGDSDHDGIRWSCWWLL